MKKLAIWLVVVAVLCAVWLGLERMSISGKEHLNPVDQTAQLTPIDKELPGGFSEEAMGRLERWLRKAEAPRVETSSLRDIFSTASEPVRMTPPPSETSEATVATVLPRLTGFVLEGAQGGPIAAIRYESRLWLVEVGDTIGPYRVEKLVAGEEVLLIEVETGEELLLTLN